MVPTDLWACASKGVSGSLVKPVPGGLTPGRLARIQEPDVSVVFGAMKRFVGSSAAFVIWREDLVVELENIAPMHSRRDS